MGIINAEYYREDIIEKYLNGSTMEELADEYDCYSSAISALLKRHNIQARPRSIPGGKRYTLPIPLEELKAKYDSGLSIAKIAKELDVSYIKVRFQLLRAGTTFRSYKESHGPPKYKVNSDYFEIINTPEKAYWLGFLYADGYNNEKAGVVCLQLQVGDRCHVEQFKKVLETNKPITTNTRKKPNKSGSFSTMADLRINSKKMSEDLAKHGCMQAKSLILKFPTTVDEKYYAAFLLGYFDGDGCMSSMPNRNSRFSVVGTMEFLTKYQELLIKNCGINKVKISTDGRISAFGYKGRHNLLKIYNYLYSSQVPCLMRKKNKFLDTFNQKIDHRGTAKHKLDILY